MVVTLSELEQLSDILCEGKRQKFGLGTRVVLQIFDRVLLNRRTNLGIQVAQE